MKTHPKRRFFFWVFFDREALRSFNSEDDTADGKDSCATQGVRKACLLTTARYIDIDEKGLQ